MVCIPKKSILVSLLGLLAASAFEVQLEWDVLEGTKDITTAMSLVRLANDTSPLGTEWTGIGWDSGSLSLQYRDDKASLIIMQIAPPTNMHQVILGKTSNLAEAKYKPTKKGGSQVFLESKVEMDPNLPYYFKVEAHHDMKENRTTYEGLYSVGNSWNYMGSLVLQHPKDPNSSSLVSNRLADEDASEARRVDVDDDNEKSESAEGDSAEGDDKEDDNDHEDAGSVDSKERDQQREEHPSQGAEEESDNEEDDSDRHKNRLAIPTVDASNPLPSTGKQMYEEDNGSNTISNNSLLSSFRSSLLDLLRSTIQPSDLNAKPKSKSRSKSKSKSDSSSDSSADPDSSSSAQDNERNASDDDDDKPLSLVKNPLKYPDFPVFPDIYSGVKRLKGGDSKAQRAAVFKKFELRDRLGQMYFISKSHAYSYDSKDDDIVYVRHYFMSASYLVSIDGTQQLSSSSPPSLPKGGKGSSAATTSTAAHALESKSSSSSKSKSKSKSKSTSSEAASSSSSSSSSSSEASEEVSSSQKVASASSVAEEAAEGSDSTSEQADSSASEQTESSASGQTDASGSEQASTGTSEQANSNSSEQTSTGASEKTDATQS
ncbi:hypothetical protein GGI12_002649 [Dipsacomyces acuminosporus]|nr:hypothetical protein GGI12_002649 [Dipsacomyces acuminosporus]